MESEGFLSSPKGLDDCWLVGPLDPSLQLHKCKMAKDKNLEQLSVYQHASWERHLHIIAYITSILHMQSDVGGRDVRPAPQAEPKNAPYMSMLWWGKKGAHFWRSAPCLAFFFTHASCSKPSFLYICPQCGLPLFCLFK